MVLQCRIVGELSVRCQHSCSVVQVGVKVGNMSASFALSHERSAPCQYHGRDIATSVLFACPDPLHASSLVSLHRPLQPFASSTSPGEARSGAASKRWAVAGAKGASQCSWHAVIGGILRDSDRDSDSDSEPERRPVCLWAGDEAPEKALRCCLAQWPRSGCRGLRLAASYITALVVAACCFHTASGRLSHPNYSCPLSLPARQHS
jgi:hypothetical protein